MTDTTKHQGKRRQLVELIQKKGITHTAVLDAVNQVPRHLFMDSGFEDHAYQDKAFPIAAGQTISQPYTVAFQSQLLQVKKGERVLEIGTGSGYQTAVLCAMGVRVFSIERQQELFRITKKLLQKIGYRPKKLIFGDGYKGLPEYAPYDGIIVTAGAPFIPKPLLHQLKVGGKLIIPLGEKEQVMTEITRVEEARFEKQEHGNFRFVPLLEDKN
ncbi:MAG: protein-L-isoaspartate(D-aspartate) O-methyltransferase [Leeuwenhoekiella sp.]